MEDASVLRPCGHASDLAMMNLEDMLARHPSISHRAGPGDSAISKGRPRMKAICRTVWRLEK